MTLEFCAWKLGVCQQRRDYAEVSEVIDMHKNELGVQLSRDRRSDLCRFHGGGRKISGADDWRDARSESGRFHVYVSLKRAPYSLLRLATAMRFLSTQFQRQPNSYFPFLSRIAH